MKYIVGILLLIAVSVAFAGDGPFPGKGLVGTYAGPYGLSVSLSVLAHDADSAVVKVEVKDSKGVTVGFGETRHSMQDSELISLIEYRGKPAVFVARVSSADADKLSISFDFGDPRRLPKQARFSRTAP